MILSDEQKFDNVTTNLRYYNDKIIESFKLYITLAIAVIGGVFYLDINLCATDDRRYSFQNVAIVLIVFISLNAMIQICNYLRSWWNYRKDLSILLPWLSKPSVPKHCLHEILMVIIVYVICLSFIILIPLYPI